MQSVYVTRQHNLRELIDQAFGRSQIQFATAMGWGNPSLVSRLLSVNPDSRKNIGSKMARDIERVAGKPANWLDVSHMQTRLEEPKADFNVSDGPRIVRRVPLISWVQAGQWGSLVDNFAPGDAEKMIETTAYVGPHAYCLRVVGDSMTNPNGSPSFPEGTLLIIDPDKDALSGSFVVVRQNGDTECTFKQLVRDGGRFFLKPLNPRYPILEMLDDATICGVLKQAVIDFD